MYNNDPRVSLKNDPRVSLKVAVETRDINRTTLHTCADGYCTGTKTKIPTFAHVGRTPCNSLPNAEKCASFTRKTLC